MEISGLGKLLHLLSQTERPGRAQFLALVCNLVAAKQCAALLWLWDPDWGDMALSRFVFSTGEVAEDSIALRQRFAVKKLGNRREPSSNPKDWTLSLAEQPEIQAWARRRGCDSYEACFPVHAMAGDRMADCIAFLQVVASQNPPKGAEDEIRLLTQCLATTILQTREQRKLNALKKLLPPLELTVSIDRILASATDSLRSISHAELCIAFLQESNLGFRAVASSMPSRHLSRLTATQGSLTALIARRRKLARVRDFGDVEERRLHFGTEHYDDRLLKELSAELPSHKVRSWLVAPVVVSSHSVAVIMLLNKMASAHLAETFTKTDEAVLDVVREFLAGVIPSNQLYEAVGLFSDIGFSDSIEDASRQLYEFVSRKIPGVVSVDLMRRKPASPDSEIRHLGGEKEWLDLSRLSSQQTQKVISVEIGGEKRYCYTREVPHLDGEHCLLVIGLRRHYLSDYEKKILGSLCKEISHVLRARDSVDRLLENFIETRHAVRSGLTGVVGYIHEAIGCYQIYRGLDFAPSTLSQARFRKSLYRVALFANKTQQILEQSRFLLGQITRDSLRLGGTSISGLVREVVDCLRIVAEDRHISIHLNNKMPEVFDQVSIDRQLIEMLIFNLVDNAIKYSHRNRPVSVDLMGTALEWRLAVTDYGVYIRQEDRDAIFQPFTRRPTGQAATTRPGTGLGLAVSKAVAEVHGGRVEVESAKLVGAEDVARTVFSVRMPRTVAKGGG